MGLNPAALQLELAESVLMEATQKHSNTLENLRLLGTTISAGYSSLKYLTTYPVNRLKLAQEFVFRVTVDYRNVAVVRAAIRLAHELGAGGHRRRGRGADALSHRRRLRAWPGVLFQPAGKPLRARELLREGWIKPGAGSLKKVSSTAA